MALKVADLLAELRLDTRQVSPGVRRAVDEARTTLTRGVGDAAGEAGDELVDRLADAAHDAAGEMTAELRREGADFQRVGEQLGGDFSDGLEAGVDMPSAVDPGELGSRSEWGAEGEQLGDAFADGVESGVRSTSASVDPGDVSGGRGEWSAEGEQLGDALADGIGDGIDGGGGAARSAADGLLGSLPVALASPAAAAGGALGALVMAGIADAFEGEEVSKKLGAALNLDRSGQAEVDSVVDSLYGDGISREVAAEAVLNVRSSFDDDELRDGLEDATRKAVEFSHVFDASMTETIGGASNLLKYGIVDDFTEAMDFMTATMRDASAPARDEILAALEEYSQFAGGLGLDGARMFAVLAEAADGGRYVVDGVGDSLKEFRNTTRDATDDTKAAWERLDLPATFEEYRDALLQGGETAERTLSDVARAILGIEDPADRSSTAVDVFGSRFEDVAGEIEAMDGILGALVDGSMTDVEGAAEANADALDTWSNRVSGSFNDVKSKIGESATETYAVIAGVFDQDMMDSNLWYFLGGKGGGVISQLLKVGAAADDTFGGLLSKLSELPGGISDAASGMWDGITAAFRAAINGVIGMWNDLTFPSFTIPSINVPGLGEIGGGTIGGWNLPDMPTFHTGGRVPGPSGTETLAKVLGGELVLTEGDQGLLNQALDASLAGVRIPTHAGVSALDMSRVEGRLDRVVEAVDGLRSGMRTAPAIGQVVVNGAESPKRTLAEISAGARAGRILEVNRR